MKKYKIKYMLGGNILVAEIKAENVEQAEYLFYMLIGPAPIESIEEVEEE